MIYFTIVLPILHLSFTLLCAIGQSKYCRIGVNISAENVFSNKFNSLVLPSYLCYEIK